MRTAKLIRFAVKSGEIAKSGDTSTAKCGARIYLPIQSEFSYQSGNLPTDSFGIYRPWNSVFFDKKILTNGEKYGTIYLHIYQK